MIAQQPTQQRPEFRLATRGHQAALEENLGSGQRPISTTVGEQLLGGLDLALPVPLDGALVDVLDHHSALRLVLRKGVRDWYSLKSRIEKMMSA
ncbi:hypothetical protein [Streptomyces sp. NBC_01546]|uniref:hypothetical protein n=1 Tax=Streptomyces sp. NBC_01546 TaxID=2975872 RepID=UPI00386C5426